ncbi:VOC family protein [Niveibacterium sp. SC-1]|uniref:VOC family protein n=1 Tax=Niveibacterium sp. SC-1 TaxID=3135646 RepID=UPI00311F422B
MRIEHLALWCHDIEAMRVFYETWFDGRSNARYDNPKKGFSSYFLSFGEGARLELMQRADVTERPSSTPLGYAHIALTLGDEAAVDRLTETLRTAGVPVVDGPRRTGDGYYESVVLDPEGNRIELTA